MSQPYDPTEGREPTEQEIRAALAEMRLAPVDEILAQVLTLLANAAQVKIGRRDGRLLIDLIEAVQDRSGEHVDPKLRTEVDGLLGQLRMAQVEAEGELRKRGEGPEPNDLGATPADAPDHGEPTTAEAPPSRPTSGGDATSRLWVPGR